MSQCTWLKREDRRADRYWQLVSRGQCPLSNGYDGMACARVAGRVEDHENHLQEHVFSGIVLLSPFCQGSGVIGSGVSRCTSNVERWRLFDIVNPLKRMTMPNEAIVESRAEAIVILEGQPLA